MIRAVYPSSCKAVVCWRRPPHPNKAGPEPVGFSLTRQFDGEVEKGVEILVLVVSFYRQDKEAQNWDGGICRVYVGGWCVI